MSYFKTLPTTLNSFELVIDLCTSESISSCGPTNWSVTNWLICLEYRIPGTESPTAGVCNFTYLSTSKKKGEFNSPRFPSRYPSNITCTYNFVAAANENTKIYFDQFKVMAANGSLITYGWVRSIIDRLRRLIKRDFAQSSLPARLGGDLQRVPTRKRSVAGSLLWWFSAWSSRIQSRSHWLKSNHNSTKTSRTSLIKSDYFYFILVCRWFYEPTRKVFIMDSKPDICSIKEVPYTEVLESLFQHL